jgi:hypothetical protein
VEVGVQQAQERAMAARKADAEKALAVFRTQAAQKAAEAQKRASERARTAAPATRSARSAPRAPDGTWPRESCSVDDPTSGGCLTPRTLHALQQARAAGFTRYTACFRGASFGEHPKGRACDFAAAATGFGGAATGGDRAYGDRLAAYFLANADRLGVLYVIWYRRIWMPATGWRPYSSGGDPSSAHTNHVHLSVQ